MPTLGRSEEGGLAEKYGVLRDNFLNASANFLVLRIWTLICPVMKKWGDSEFFNASIISEKPLPSKMQTHPELSMLANGVMAATKQKSEGLKISTPSLQDCRATNLPMPNPRVFRLLSYGLFEPPLLLRCHISSHCFLRVDFQGSRITMAVLYIPSCFHHPLDLCLFGKFRRGRGERDGALIWVIFRVFGSGNQRFQKLEVYLSHL